MKTSRPSVPIASSSRARRRRISRKFVALLVETLEDRKLLAIGAVSAVSAIPAPYYVPTDTNLFDAQNGPLANLGTEVVSVYQAFSTDFAAAIAADEVTPAAATALMNDVAAKFPSAQFEGGMVEMNLNSLGGDFNQFVSSLTNLGVQVTDSSSAYGIVDGWVPIDELPTIARLPQTEAGSAIEASTSHAFQGFQGIAYNEGETSLMADASRSQYGLTGAGVTIGVISDSVNSVGGGLQDSYNTGDLDPSHPVTVLNAGSGEDEGRAMLESIHDISPGASLQFSAAGNGDLAFMQSIVNLANAGSKIIVDDISDQDEPFFQDGLIAQGVDYATARGGIYFSAAANSGPDQGYLSNFRPITATLGSGASAMTGTFQNFNGGGGASSALLQVTTLQDDAQITFQYDQPFKTQEPAGATASVTSDMSFYVFNSSGAIVASGTDDNLATQQPYQQVTVPSAGTYSVAIKLVSGTAPGHVEFVGLDNAGAFTVSQTFGSAGGTYYPSSEGHEVSANTIGVGATPWWATTPFLGQSPLQNEASSSTGPGLIDLSPKGNPIVTQLTQNPAVTGPDGNSTSFFGQLPADTTIYDPSTPYNFVPTGQQNNKLFFGTSEAAPNLAAVAALMLQENPSLTRVQILQDMEKTAEPMNGTPAGQYNVQSGYGFVNAIAAIKAIAPSSSLATSTTTATPSNTTPTVNTPFTLTAAVSGSGGTPTGSVDFYDISYNIDEGSFPLSGGQATASVTASQLGAHIYLATYSGNGTYAKSTAYVLLDVVPTSPGFRHSAVRNPTQPTASAIPGILIPLDGQASSTTAGVLIPLSTGVATTTGSSAGGDLTVGGTATTATESDLLAKKHLAV